MESRSWNICRVAEWGILVAVVVLTLCTRDTVSLSCQRCIYNSSLPEGARVRVYHSDEDPSLGHHTLINTINCTLDFSKQKHVNTFDCDRERFSKRFRKSGRSRYSLMTSCSRYYRLENNVPVDVRRDCSYGSCPSFSAESLRRDLVLVYEEMDCCFVDSCNTEKYMDRFQSQQRLPQRSNRRKYGDDYDQQGSGNNMPAVRTYVVDVRATTAIPRTNARKNAAAILKTDYLTCILLLLSCLLRTIST